MTGQNKGFKFKSGDEVYHIGYLCTGIIKKIETDAHSRPIYLLEWYEYPLKDTGIIYFMENLLESLDFKYYIKKARGKSTREIIKDYRDKIKKYEEDKRRSIFSSVNGKIILN